MFCIIRKENNDRSTPIFFIPPRCWTKTADRTVNCPCPALGPKSNKCQTQPGDQNYQNIPELK